MGNTGNRGIDVRQSGNRIVFRASLKDSAGAKLTTGTTNLTLYEVQDDGTLKSYDFNDNTFKTTALTTANLALTHRTGNNGGTNTGVWTGVLSTLTGFTRGALYIAQVNNSGASPTDQEREFQYGDGEGDFTVTSAGATTVGTNNDKTGYTASTVSDKTGYSLTQTFPTNFSALSIDSGGVAKANLVQILGTALTETAGLLAAGFKKFFNVSSPTGTVNSIPDAVAGATGGLATADALATAQTEITETGADVDEIITTLATMTTNLQEANDDLDELITTAGTLATATALATAQTEITETGADIDEVIATLATMGTNLQEANDDLDELITTTGTLATATALATAQTEITETGADVDELIATAANLATATALSAVAADVTTAASAANGAQTAAAAAQTAAEAAEAAAEAIDVQASLTAQGYTTGRADLLDHLDADVSSVSGSGATLYGESGSVTFTYTVFDTDNLTPLEGVAVYVSSDSAGLFRSQVQVTDALGRVRFALEPSTVYVWRSRHDKVFVNPQTLVVS